MKHLILILFTLLSLQNYGQNTPEDTVKCTKADQFFSQFKFDEALKYYQQCFATDTQNTDILAKIAICHYRLGHYPQAEKAYLKLLDQKPEDITARNNLAAIYMMTENYEMAGRQYKKLIRIDYSNGYYHKKYADVKVKLGDFQRALAEYEVSLMQNPEDIEVISKLINIYQGLKIFSQADTLLNMGLSFDPDNPKLVNQKALLAYKQGKYPEVISTLKDYLSSAEDTTILHAKLLGASFYHTGNYVMAISMLNRALDGTSKPELIHYYLGLSYKNYGDNERCIFHLKKAIESGISDNISDYYKNLAIIYEDEGKHREAIDAYKAAYDSSKEKILLYFLARNCDIYYRDKKIALNYYKQYLAEYDTANIELMDYSKDRISILKERIHIEN